MDEVTTPSQSGLLRSDLASLHAPGVDLERLDIAGAIYKSHEARSGAGRTYLGGSVIGTPCSRALWYQFTGAQDAKFPGRMLRLF